MWALQLVAPHQFQTRILPAPDPVALERGEVLVRMILGGICGSDLRGYRSAVQIDGSPPRPGFPLHELVGEVVATTDPELAEGDLVVGWASASNALAELVVTQGDGLARVE